jgi:hypothetical protein
VAPRTATLPPTEPFAILYDLRDPDAWACPRRHRGLWGKLYTEIHTVDNDHIVLHFRPAPNPRWRPWEEVRKQWILREVA